MLMLTDNFQKSTLRTPVAVAVWAALAVACSGCAANTPLLLTPNATPLPDLKRTSTDGMMQPAQQQKAIADMAAKKAEQEAQAIKAIEKSR